MTANAGVILCTEVVPRIRSAIPAAAKPIGAEDASELIQDTIAHAAALLHRAEAVGKQVAASTVAYFAIKLTRSGRRSTGSSATDVMHPGTQLAGRARLVSFDEPLGFDEAGDAITLADVFDNKQDDPSMLAARNLDWETFIGKQTRRGRKLLAVVAEGFALRHGARLLGLSDSGIQLEKKKLALALAEFMGANILAEVNRQPLWRNNIMAGRERQACRAARLCRVDIESAWGRILLCIRCRFQHARVCPAKRLTVRHGARRVAGLVAGWPPAASPRHVWRAGLAVPSLSRPPSNR